MKFQKAGRSIRCTEKKYATKMARLHRKISACFRDGRGRPLRRSARFFMRMIRLAMANDGDVRHTFLGDPPGGMKGRGVRRLPWCRVYFCDSR